MYKYVKIGYILYMSYFYMFIEKGNEYSRIVYSREISKLLLNKGGNRNVRAGRYRINSKGQ